MARDKAATPARKRTAAAKGLTAHGKRKAGGAPKSEGPREGRPAAALTPRQDARYSAMRRAGINAKTISDSLAERGVSVSRQAVGQVLRNRFHNEDVVRQFCLSTETTREKMFPEPMFNPTAQ